MWTRRRRYYVPPVSESRADGLERLRQLALDAGLALLLTALVVVGSDQEVRHSPGALPMGSPGTFLLLVAGLSLTARRRLPLLTYSVALSATWLYLASGWPPGPVYLAPFAALLTLVADRGPRTWATAATAGAALLAVAHLGTSGSPLSTAIWAAVWLSLTALFAGWLQLRRRYLAESSARSAEESRRRAAEERLGIAREMHDVVGHSLAVISLQAGVADHLLETRPEEARKAVAAIRQVSHEALNELRAELALLRGEGSAGERRPAPDLRALPGLVASMRGAGLPVELELDVDGRRISDLTAAAAYRIAQESLTNVVRHAGSGSRARVRIQLAGEELEVEVVDNGRGSAAAPAGSGIDGMRERVAALGGRFAAGNRPGGGFRVWASMPSPSR